MMKKPFTAALCVALLLSIAALVAYVALGRSKGSTSTTNLSHPRSVQDDTSHTVRSATEAKETQGDARSGSSPGSGVSQTAATPFPSTTALTSNPVALAKAAVGDQGVSAHPAGESTNSAPTSGGTGGAAGNASGTGSEGVPKKESLADLLQGTDLSQPGAREQVAARYAELKKERKARAWELALQRGLPTRVTGTNGRVVELMDFDGERPLYFATENKNAAISSGAATIQLAPYLLTGSGGTIGIWDAGKVLTSHQELLGRVTISDSAPVFDDHSTHVAGTIGATGVVSAARGMAPSTKIKSFDWDSDTSEMLVNGAATATDATRLLLSNHSYGYLSGYEYNGISWLWYGTGTTAAGAEQAFGRYDSTTRDLDAVLNNVPYFLSFWAASNDRDDTPPNGATVYSLETNSNFTYTAGSSPGGDGTYKNGYDCIAYMNLAKNVVTVGAVNDAVSGGVRNTALATMASFSSWGPTDDGRIKPDLVGNGVGLYSCVSTGATAYDNYSGTSMATPNVCGSATLVAQYFRSLSGGAAMRASTLKALLIHTADDIGTPGPDYQNGWGLINVAAAADLVLSNATSSASPRIIESQVTTAIKTQTHTFAWDGASPIRVTLCWTDPEHAAITAHDSRVPALVHNLDLTVTAPNGTVFRPYIMPYVGTWTQASITSAATTGKNNVDNVEMVRIAAPPVAGNYVATVTVDGSLTRSSQAYSLIVTGNVTNNAPTKVIAMSGDMDFGNVLVGASAQRTLTLRNTGNTALTVSGIALPFPFTGNWSGSLAPGGSQDVTITFTPVASQTYSGSVSVTSDATSGVSSLPISGVGTVPGSVTTLNNGQPVTGLSAALNGQLVFKITVPPGQNSLSVQISGGTGDADLYVRRGSVPTLSLYDYRPYLTGNAETVTVPSPAPGDWYVMLNGYSAFSGVTLTATYNGATNSKILRLAGNLQFGTVLLGTSEERTLSVSNDGDSPLTISSITTPAGFTPAWTSRILAAGETAALPVTFQPTAIQPYSGTLTVTSNKTSGVNTTPVAGSGYQGITPLQNGVAIMPLNGEAGGHRNFVFTVPAGQTKLQVQIYGGTGNADLFLKRGSQASPSAYDYASQTSTNADLISIDNPVAGDWYVDLYGFSQYASITLLGSYYAGTEPTRQIQVNAGLDFGTVRVNDTGSRTLTISNIGTGPLVVNGISIAAPDGLDNTFIASWAGTVLPGASQEVPVQFIPRQAGTYGHTLTVDSNATLGTGQTSLIGVAAADTSVTALLNGVPVPNIWASQGGQKLYKISVPAGASILKIRTTGGTGDVDLYVRQGAAPTTSLFDYAPFIWGNDEKVEITAPSPGDWYVLLDAYESFAGVSLLAQYTVSSAIQIEGEMNFGAVPVGVATPRTLTIRNVGTATFAVSQILLPNGFSGNWAGLVPPGGSQAVPITFTPAAIQNYDGTLVVVCDAGSGTPAMSISGLGVDPALNIRQPDALIGLSTDALLGDGIYNATGLTQKVKKIVLRGREKTCVVRIQNDGNVASTYSVKAKGVNTGFKVRFYRDGTTIGSLIQSTGGYITESIPPGGSIDLQVVVRAKLTAPTGSSTVYTFKVKSVENPAELDAVKMRFDTLP